MVKLVLWTVISMITLDAGINRSFGTLENGLKPSQLTRYFDYGRSTESKLLRIIGSENANAANIAKAGWYQPVLNVVGVNAKPQVYMYGMSFSNHIGQIIAQETEDFGVQLYAGPGAPLNHSYAYYLRHRPYHKKGDVVILGILASSIPHINTMAHMTSSFEAPATHLYPRYSLDSNDDLIEKKISIYSLNEFREAMQNKERWLSVKNRLSVGDSFYNDVVFSADFADKSTYLSVFRRAWAAKQQQNTTNKYHDHKGFKNTDRMIEVTQKLVSEFALKARQDGVVPMVILFNNRGFGDHLFSILKSVLTKRKIPYYSTHHNFPSTQLSNFLPDGHFKPEVDHLIALAVMKKINKFRQEKRYEGSL